MPVASATPGASGNDRDWCYLRAWVAFGEGYWNGKLYSRADCLEMGQNFRRLSLPQSGRPPLYEPKVKIGHDGEQELSEWLKASKGLPSLGTVIGLEVAANGLCAFTLKMPALIGGLCNGGWYKDGSIEIAPPLPDPEDAARKLYPVLVALSLLGEEQPGVPMRYPMPRAVFADGSEVPAETKPTWLLQAATAVKDKFSLRPRTPRREPASGRFSFGGHSYATAVVCFSAMTPLPQGTTAMTPEQKAALTAAGFTDEQIAKMEAGLTQMASDPPPAPNPAPAPKPGEDPIAAMSAKFAADAGTPPYAKEMMSAFSSFAADCSKRFSAMEAAVGDMQKIKPDAQMAAKFALDFGERMKADHRAAVERVVDQAIAEGRYEPRDRDDKITAGLSKDNTACFAAGQANAGKTAFAVWRDELLSRKPSRFFSQDPALTDPPGDADPANDAFVRRAAEHIPALRGKLATK